MIKTEERNELPEFKEYKKQAEITQKEIVKETKEKLRSEKPQKPFLKRILIFFSFGIIATFMVWTNNVRTADNATIILMLILSIMMNFVILLASFATNVGTEIILRYKNKWRYKSGQYINTVFHYKSGVIKELFIKKDKDTGGFKVDNSNYTTNPRLLFAYKGIPTYHHREGQPDPLNIWMSSLASQMSTSEMDTVMLAGAQFDFKQWLEKNKQILIVAVFLMVGAAIVGAYFGYQNFEMLRDGTYKGVKVICENLPK